MLKLDGNWGGGSADLRRSIIIASRCANHYIKP